VVGNPGPPNKLTLHLHGSATDDVALAYADVPNQPPISFGLDLVPNLGRPLQGQRI
jgi:hypothetical protein